MNQFKKAQVIMLPTEQQTNIVLNPTIKKLLLTKDWGHHDHSNKPIKEFIYIGFVPQHLYIISDDEIKVDDWYYTTLDKEILKANKDTEVIMNEANINIKTTYKHTHFKIIATTNTSLSKKNDCDCGATTYEGCSQCLKILPQLSQQFITNYIESYNKDEVITDVLVEYENNKVTALDKNSKEMWDFVTKLKINPDNTITIKPTKDSWNREEAKSLIRQYREEAWKNGNTVKVCEDWITKNL